MQSYFSELSADARNILRLRMLIWAVLKYKLGIRLEEIVEAVKPVQPAFSSIDEVLKDDDWSIRKQGRHK